MAKRNNAGIDGTTFADIERTGVESFIKDIQKELIEETYQQYLPERTGQNA